MPAQTHRAQSAQAQAQPALCDAPAAAPLDVLRQALADGKITSQEALQLAGALGNGLLQGLLCGTQQGDSETVAPPAGTDQASQGPSAQDQARALLAEAGATLPPALAAVLTEQLPVDTSAFSGGGSVAQAVNLRAGPSTGDAVLRTLQPGEQVYVYADQDSTGWTRVQAGGQDAWISSALLQTGLTVDQVQTGPGGGNTDTSAHVDGDVTLPSGGTLRSAPHAEASSVVVLAAGTSARVSAEVNTSAPDATNTELGELEPDPRFPIWYQVTVAVDDTEHTGWVAAFDLGQDHQGQRGAIADGYHPDLVHDSSHMGQCVAYVKTRLREMGMDERVVGNIWADAHHWDNNGAPAGGVLLDAPRRGVVAVWDSFPGSSVGHVAIVEDTYAIEDAGETHTLVVLTDSNARSTEQYGMRTIRSDDDLWPQHFLQLPSTGMTLEERIAHTELWRAQNP
jgi:hypothetical protein